MSGILTILDDMLLDTRVLLQGGPVCLSQATASPHCGKQHAAGDHQRLLMTNLNALRAALQT